MRSENLFIEGIRVSLPVVASAAPFGVLFGAVAVDNGFSITEAVLMSALLFAGASQMVGIELFGQEIPAWVVVMSIFAVNFRHVLYSAAVSRHLAHYSLFQQALAFFLLTDPQFAETELRAHRKRSVEFLWYLGMGLPIWIAWVLEAWVGALFGELIADYYHIGIDFFLPIYFLGLLMSFRSRSNWIPVVLVSAIASTGALFLLGSPWHVSIGAIAGIVAAVFLYKPEHLGAKTA